MDTTWAKAATLLKAGEVGIVPTDTIYGLVAMASDRRAVEKVYALKGRDFSKPCIILIADPKDMNRFGIAKPAIEKAKQYWPDKTSVVVPLPKNLDKKFSYLHRGKLSLAFRCPSFYELKKLIKSTGPLIAPSANPEGNSPATSLLEAHNYFLDKVSFYVDGGNLDTSPSKIVSLVNDKPVWLR
jgi:L-threonylcarbamoyladenylate synthase